MSSAHDPSQASDASQPGPVLTGVATPADDTPVGDARTAAAFAALSQELIAGHDEQPTLQRICERALEVVPAAETCGVTLRRRRGRLETVASTGLLAEQCDELQYDLGEGPCMSATLEAETYLVPDVGNDERWPRWGPAVAELGVRSMIAVQLSSATIDSPHDALGAVNLYSTRVGAFGRDDVELASIYATHAANALGSARLVTGLEAAVQGRHLIGVAQGILMQRYDLTMEQAFTTLQRYSSTTNTKLRDLARMVVMARGLPQLDGQDPSASAPADLSQRLDPA